MQNLLKYNVLEFLPAGNKDWRGKTVVPILIITVEKVDALGLFLKFKSRICARGDRQAIDEWTITSSPVVNHFTNMMVLNKAVSIRASNPNSAIGLSIFDVGSAYLEVDIGEEVFVRLNKKCVNLLSK
jgi:hypothetical protein